MSERIIPGRRPLAMILWLAAAVLLLAGCNLNNVGGGGGQGNVIVSGPPVVTIAAPLPNATYLEGVAVNIQALVSNAGSDISRVEVVVDGNIVATVPNPNAAGSPTFSLTQSWTATGSGAHTITVTAFRGDGSNSQPASVSVTVVGQASSGASPTPGGGSNSQQSGNNSGQPTRAPTEPPEPTEPPPPSATATSSAPTATFSTGVNVRAGPSTLFNPPIGSFAANSTAEIMGVTPAGDWYKVRYYNGTGWVAASLLTVSGDSSGIPVDAGPPVPTATFTPVPATATPITNSNLVIVGTPTISPHPLNCGETATIRVTVQNNGTGATTSDSAVLVEDIHVGSNARQASTNGAVPILQPGQSFVSDMRLTVSTYYAEGHRIVITIDSNNQVPETNEGDNRFQSDYVLAKAGCQ